MRRAIELARKGIGTTSPNPRVGAVLVRGRKIVGEGFHEKAGGSHAEIAALHDAGPKARGADLYITLEPCAHTGRTPPCVDALLKAGIRKVFIGEPDPNPITSRRGIRILRARGVGVQTGILEKEAHALNLPFHKWANTGLPYVTLKCAQSLDGKIATGRGLSRWISSPASRTLGQKLRREADAILVGIETVLKDNPRLDLRPKPREKDWTKIVLDSTLKVSPQAKIFKTPGRVILATTARSSPSKRKALARAAEVWVLPEKKGRVDLKSLLKELPARGAIHLLVEGGGETHAAFLEARLADELYLITAPKILGGRFAPTSFAGEGAKHPDDGWTFKKLECEKLGPDFIFHGVF